MPTTEPPAKQSGLARCIHYKARVHIAGLGWFDLPTEFLNWGLADTAAFSAALRWDGDKTEVLSLECDGSCKQGECDE